MDRIVNLLIPGRVGYFLLRGVNFLGNLPLASLGSRLPWLLVQRSPGPAFLPFRQEPWFRRQPLALPVFWASAAGFTAGAGVGGSACLGAAATGLAATLGGGAATLGGCLGCTGAVLAGGGGGGAAGFTWATGFFSTGCGFLASAGLGSGAGLTGGLGFSRTSTPGLAA